MPHDREALGDFLRGPSDGGGRISVTGRWVPAEAGGRFRRSADSDQMREEWEAIFVAAQADDGVLSSEINHAVGEDAVLVHHVFADADALLHHFSTTAASHVQTLTSVATPQLHIVRGDTVPTSVQDALSSTGAPAVFGERVFGYVRDDATPDPGTAIEVTAKWTCTPSEASRLEDLTYWWQRVGTDAHEIEKGLLRFEAYQVVGEDALIIHETFRDTAELKFHLTKGTAATYKKDIDQVASPEAYYFRGPVSWTIRTYSKFMHLPATYTSRGSHFG